MQLILHFIVSFKNQLFLGLRGDPGPDGLPGYGPPGLPGILGPPGQIGSG